MKRWLGLLVFGAVCVTIGLLASTGLHMRDGGVTVASATPSAAPSSVARPEGGPRVRVSETFVQRFGIQTARVSARRIAPAIDLVGSVDFDADRVADVGARIRGRVTRVHVSTGVDVGVGDPLVELESASLGDVLATRTSAQAQARAARARLARETALYAERLTTLRAVEEARADVARFEAEARGTGQRLAAMGAGSDGGRTVTLRAPIAGRVIRRNVIIGQTIDETDVVMRVADLARVFVHLDVFERDLAQVLHGDRAVITSEAYPDRPFAGVVSMIDSVVDLRTRTSRVRIAVDNAKYLLRPGQFVTARLRTAGSGEREVTTVPRAAIVQLEGRPAVFVARAPREYEASVLGLGAIDGDAVEVVRGLSSGDEVVTEGAFALKSELLR